jgi:hypothetical protein
MDLVATEAERRDQAKVEGQGLAHHVPQAPLLIGRHTCQRTPTQSSTFSPYSSCFTIKPDK